MIPIDPEQATKITGLRALQAVGTSPRVAELVLIEWPAPDGPIYYATRMAADLLESNTILDQLDGPIELRLGTGVFLQTPHDVGIGDDTISLDFWDADNEITRLILTHGAGVRVEVFYYFPDVDLFLSEWWGHLQPPKAIGGDRLVTEAEAGFRSSNLPLPSRAFLTGCQAVFGGLLATQAEIDEGDCPYNRHLGAVLAGVVPTWINNANGTAGAGGEFLKTSGGTAWNCGASHSSPVASGDAMMRATFAGAYAAFGFWTIADPVNGNENYAAILPANPDGSITARAGLVYSRPAAATWTTGDTFEIHLRGGVFHFYKGGTEIATDMITPAPVYPLYLGVAIMDVGAGLATSRVSVGDAGVAPAFGNLDPGTGLPYTHCPRNTPAVCSARLGDSKSYLAFDTVAESHVVHETKGPNITVTSRGNENNLKRPLRVIAGFRHVSDLDLLAFVVEPNTNHPDEGSVKCLFACSEGSIQAINAGKINGVTIGPQHYNYRKGEKRQGQTSFSPNILNYSGTSLFMGVAQGDFTSAGAEDLRGEVDIEGLNNVRIYRDQENFSEQYTTERGWWLLHCLRNKRWGYGLDVARVNLVDFLILEAWLKETVAQKDKDGNDTTGPRSQFNAELIDRTAQQQIADICQAGRIGLPFPHRGFLRVVPLRRAEEIFSSRIFTDRAFWGCLARQATGSEASTWINALEAARGDNEALLAECQDRMFDLFHTSEYTARARTDEEFVTDCYRAYLRREPEPAGFAAWLAVLPTVGRDGVLNGFGGSQEFMSDCQDDEIATFTDRGDHRNICLDQPETEGGKSTLTFSMQGDADLCNRIVLTFDDATQQHQQIPLTFEDVQQQLRAGRSFGDTSRRAVERPFSAFGVTTIGEAGRLGNLLLDLGEFDEGGLKNNLRVNFISWYLEAVELHKYKLIKVESDKLDQINAAREAQGFEPFDYFRIRSITRQSDLTVEISAQAYPLEYYERLELLTVGPPVDPTPPGTGGFDPDDPNGPARNRLPWDVTLPEISYTADTIVLRIGSEEI
jgi:hypothetical protein